MSIRMTAAALAALVAFAAAPAEAGHGKRHAKAAPAKAAPAKAAPAKAAPAKAAHAGCPIRDAMARVHARLADRKHHVRAERPARVHKVAKVEKAAKPAPKK